MRVGPVFFHFIIIIRITPGHGLKVVVPYAGGRLESDPNKISSCSMPKWKRESSPFSVKKQNRAESGVDFGLVVVRVNPFSILFLSYA